MLTPPPPLRRAMIRSTLRAMESVSPGDPMSVLLAVQLESLRTGCPHENKVKLRKYAVLCQDCFSGFPVRLEEEDG